MLYNARLYMLSHAEYNREKNPNIYVIMCRAIHQIAKCNT
jgi:hypothetical protein